MKEYVTSSLFDRPFSWTFRDGCFLFLLKYFAVFSVQFSCSVVSDSLRLHEPQHARPPCPSPTPRVHSNPCPLSRWCHPTISFSVIPFSCPHSFPASGSFQMSQLFTSCGQSIGVSASASVLPVNTQDWSPLGWTGWISLLSKATFKECPLLMKSWVLIILEWTLWNPGVFFYVCTASGTTEVSILLSLLLQRCLR